MSIKGMDPLSNERGSLLYPLVPTGRGTRDERESDLPGNLAVSYPSGRSYPGV